MKRGSRIRQSVAVSACLMAALFLLPLIVITPVQTETPQQATSVPPVEKTPLIKEKTDAELMLRVLNNGIVEEMNLGQYLVGVVRAEMPASFQLEALKAQAVAARTYTLYQIRSGGNHGESADVCTDFSCCQAYLDEEQARSNWGESASVYEEKVEQAVTQTDGQAVLYGGMPILAVFHAASSGMTRPAGAVWQTDLPYLAAVESPERGGQIPNYYSRAAFTKEEFRRRILAVHPDAVLSGAMSGWLKHPVTDDAGNVETVEVGGIRLKGSSLRTILELRSACFEWAVEDEKLVFYVTGHGHGVGLSQYGANAMAEEGADYREILTHYYTGVTVEPCLQELFLTDEVERDG